MNDPLAVERCQARQGLADDRDRDPRLEARLLRAGGDDAIVEVAEALVGDAGPGLLEDLGSEQPREVVAVDPLHLHDADPPLLDEVVDVEEVVLLDQGDAGRHLGNPPHRLDIEALRLIPLW